MPEWLNFALGVVGMIVIPLGTLQLTLHQRNVIAQKRRTKKIKRRLNHHDDCLDIVKKEVRALSMHRRAGDNGNGAKLAVGLATSLAGLICLLSGSAIAQPVPPTTQCVTSALAGGTPDALTLPLLPCSVTSTLVIVTLSHTNQTTSPTMQMVGARAEPVVNFDGSSPFVGELLAGSQLIFTNNGSAWIVLTGSGTPTGITELTGDGTAGPGIGSQVLTLATVATPGTNLKITYNNKGLVTSGASAACADLSNAGTACLAATGTSGHVLPFLDGSNIWSGAQTFEEILTGVITPSILSNAYTALTTDCGKLVRITNSNVAVTVTLPNSLSPGCSIAWKQVDTAQVTFAAGSGANLVSAHSYTKTFGQNAIVGTTVDGNAGGAAAAYTLTGDGA